MSAPQVTILPPRPPDAVGFTRLMERELGWLPEGRLDEEAYLLRESALGPQSIPDEAWEELSWHIREVGHYNDLPMQEHPLARRWLLIARILRRQGKLNRLALHAAECALAMAEGMEVRLLYLNARLSQHSSREAPPSPVGLLSQARLNLAAARHQNHPRKGLLPKRLRRSQDRVNDALAHGLEQLQAVLQWMDQRLQEATQAMGLSVTSPLAESHPNAWADTSWNLREVRHLSGPSRRPFLRLPLLSRLLRPQGKVNAMLQTALHALDHILADQASRLSILEMAQRRKMEAPGISPSPAHPSPAATSSSPS